MATKKSPEQKEQELKDLLMRRTPSIFEREVNSGFQTNALDALVKEILEVTG